MFYVTMTDTFMSGWGYSRGKYNKLVFECETMEEAEIVAENARNRTDQKFVSIRSTKPWYSPRKFYVQYKTKKDYESWYDKDFFKKEQRRTKK